MHYLKHRYADSNGDLKAGKALPALIWTAVILMILHVVEIILWALAYLLLLPGDHGIDSFEKAAYFSAVTFTTLGYGDILP